MRRALVLSAVAAGILPAVAAGRVQMMVVGRAHTLLAPRQVGLGSATVKIGRRSCRVPSGTALAGLLATRLRVRVTDVAGCDPASMFVTRIGTESNRGFGGWEYKVGHVDPSTGAGDPAGRLRPGQQLLWYWCVRAGSCQRTLDVSIKFTTRSARIHVRGYDDIGHGVSIAGATVHFGTMALTTNAQGVAVAPLNQGRYLVYATKRGLVRSFPTTVGVVP